MRQAIPALLRAAPALLALAGAAACAQPVAPQSAGWELSAGAVHRRLVERADDGRRLVTERGPLLRLGLAGGRPLASGGAVRAEAAIASGELDYHGQTQGGAPLETRSGQRDLELSLGWRPWPAASWGEAWLTLQALQQRRQIASTPAALGLRETSTLLSPGLRYTRTFAAAGWTWQPSVELRASVHHRLEIGFGAVFDAADLGGGRRRELALGLEAAQAGSPWRWGVQWTHTRQAASASQAIQRGGVDVGSARQPRIRIDDVMLRATRSF